MAIGAEAKIQLQVMEYIKQVAKVPVIHVANERNSNAQHGAFLKRMGVVAGFPDLFFPKPNATFKDMYIELKVPGGRVSEAQASFIRERIAEGSCAHIAYSAQEAILMIQEFYSIE